MAYPLDLRCDYCDEGNVAIAGWHYYHDDELDLEAYRVPCRLNPPTDGGDDDE